MRENFLSALDSGLEKFGIRLEEVQREQFAKFFELVVDKNKDMNLTAITEPQEFAVKHIIDSLSGYDEAIFPPHAKVVDVGTGGGFPGIPLKILRPDLEIFLLDSLKKRLNFLAEASEKLGLKEVKCLHMRAEDAGRDTIHREVFDVAVSRAVSRLSVLVELCLPFVKINGFFIAWKGRAYEEELHEAQRAIRLLGGKFSALLPVNLPKLEDKRAIIVIKKDAPTPKNYPRKAGVPLRKPL